jgi:hypothetical protein
MALSVVSLRCVIWFAVGAYRTSSSNHARFMGQFAAELERQQLGDPKVVEAIKQMTKLHRNPLIHPEVISSTEEAFGIIGTARSAIAAMLAALQMFPARPALPLPQGRPDVRIASRSLSSGAHSRDPLARKDEMTSSGATNWHDGQITKSLSSGSRKNIPLAPSGKSMI